MTLARRVLMSSVENPEVQISSPAIIDAISGGFGGIAELPVVTPTRALGLSAVWRAVNVIAGSIAGLPLHAYRSASGDGRVQATGQAADLLADPHPDLTPFDLWELLVTHLLLWGNAYAFLERDQAQRVRRLHPVHPSRVRPGRTSDGVMIFQLDGREGYTSSELLHIPGFGYDGIQGISPIAAARTGLGLTVSAEEFGAKFFADGSLATGVLTFDRALTAEQADRLQQRWKAKRAGLGHAHEAIVLDGGAKFERLSIPPEDAQFLETRSFQTAEIARMYGVPPHLLMDTDKSTSWGTGIESQGIGFVTYTLRPWMTRIEQRVSRILRPAPVYARFSAEGLLRGDSASRAAFYTQLWNLGVLSTNEIRALEERPPVPGGDVRYRPLNMGELGVTDDQGPSDDEESMS